MALPAHISWDTLETLSLEEKKESLALLEKSVISKTPDGKAMIARLKADIADA